MKKGISMITLIITIVVLTILTATVVLNISDTNLIDKASTAVDKYNEKQYEIFELVQNMEKELEELMGRKNETVYNGSLVGVNGVIQMPFLLNDTSKQYILDIESDMYTGQALLNVYMYDGNYIGATGINTTSNYAIEVRHLMLELKGESDSGSMESFFGTAEIQPLTYVSDGSAATIQYSLANIGSEVTIKKITKVDREYTMFAKLINNFITGGIVSAYDMKEAILFCVNSNRLGYDYLNEQAQNSSSESTLTFDENLEMQTLKNIVNTRTQDLNDIEYSITDQILLMLLYYFDTTESFVEDFYTLANIFEENEFLNEYYYRSVGNTTVPFTLLFADDIMVDLNEDGLLGTYNDTSTQASMFATGNAGLLYRNFADIYSSLYPLMQKYPSMSGMSAMDQLKYQEVVLISGVNSNGTTNGIKGMVWSLAQMWTAAYQTYNNAQMDTMYSLMYQNGITINMAGLKMGWNSIISEVFASEIGRLLPAYDFRMDLDAINRQGVSAIQDQLYEYISAVQQSIRGEDTSNAEE